MRVLPRGVPPAESAGQDRPRVAVDDAAPLIGQWRWDLESGAGQLDASWCQSLGLDDCSGDEHLARWAKAIHPADVQEFRARCDQLRTGESNRLEVEYRVLTSNSGWQRLFQLGRVVERGTKGEARCVIGVCLAMPERGRPPAPEVSIAEFTDRVQQDTLRTQAKILETMREGVVLIDSATHLITLTNSTFDQMFGYNALELLGRAIEPLFSMPTLQRQRLERTLRDGSEATEVMPVEFECARKDGSRFVATCVIKPLRISGADRWLAVLNDVTERKRLEREIIEIANREQQRIGSDLHDGLGQDLTGIALMLRGVAAQLRKEGSAAHLEVEDVIGLVNNAIENTRDLARGLSPVGGERGGLNAALKTLAARASERYGVRVEYHSKCKHLRLSEASATHLYRIAQEALTNVLRHSLATDVAISLETSGNELQLRVDDNGRGFEEASCEAGGLGLKIMRYRAQMLGGDLILESGPNGGVSVRCSCPLDTITAGSEASWSSRDPTR